MNARAALASLLVVVASAGRAGAEPTVWERSRDPGSAARAEAVDEVDALLHKMRIGRDNRAPASLRAALGRDARAVLDRVHAAESSDPALRHRYGAVLAELYEAVKDERALAAACDHFRFVATSRAPQLLRAEAANDLAICEAHLGHHGTEITAYDAALRLEVHDETRAVLYANRAEALMYQGRMIAAVAGYRTSLATLPVYAYPSMATSTHWGLAVALDRTGDLGAAFEELELARTLDPADAAIHGPTWFYVPDYDEHWYAALGYWQHARTASDALERVHLYEDAASAWSRYLDRAPDADRWLGLAALRRRAVERELAAAKKTLGELERIPEERPDEHALEP